MSGKDTTIVNIGDDKEIKKENNNKYDLSSEDEEATNSDSFKFKNTKSNIIKKIELSEDDDLYDSAKLKRKFRNEILTEYIYPDNVENLKTLLVDRKNYSKLLQVMRIIRIIIAAIVIPSLLLSDTKFPGKDLGYAATIISFFVSFLEITDRIIVQVNKKRRDKINLILKSLGIEYQIPETTLDDPISDKAEVSKRKNTFSSVEPISKKN